MSTQNIQNYIQLIKPGIVIVNSITTFGGIILAGGDFDILKTLWILLGTIFVIASGCALNNVMDIDIDSKMERTSNRVMVQGVILKKNAIAFSIVLLGFSLIVFYLTTNLLTVMIALFGWLVYIVLYTKYFKRTSSWGIVIGAFSGAVPPLIGYCGITNQIDLAAWIIFSILFVWQLPHSWAIVIRRLDDFRNAGIKALVDMENLHSTKIFTVITSFLLIPITYSLTFFNYTGLLYGIMAGITGILFFALCLSGFFTEDERSWAKKVFIFSVNHLTVLIIFLTIDIKI